MMIGASPPSPKCEISVTAAAKIDATPASIALPPAVINRAPASTVNVRPAATIPCDPRTSPRTGTNGCCAESVTPASARAAAAAAPLVITHESYYGSWLAAQPAHRQRAEQGTRREEQERPLPSGERTHGRHDPHADHGQQEPGTGLERQRGTDVRTGRVVSDQRRELRRVGDDGEPPDDGQHEQG